MRRSHSMCSVLRMCSHQWSSWRTLRVSTVSLANQFSAAVSAQAALKVQQRGVGSGEPAAIARELVGSPPGANAGGSGRKERRQQREESCEVAQQHDCVGTRKSREDLC